MQKCEQKQICGGDQTGANGRFIWKCYRNNSGNRFFFSYIDLNSADVLCYAINRNPYTPVQDDVIYVVGE